MKDKWDAFDEWEPYQRKAALSWRKSFLSEREAYVFTLPYGELAA